MKFTYEPTSIGWTDVEIEINGQQKFYSVSYLSEPLIDLTDGLIQLIPELIPPDEVKKEISFEWHLEPSGIAWNMKNLDGEKLGIKIIYYEDIYHRDIGTLK
ncbi:hypothetical protein [Aneurinibacillus uraniidurans]|uniref:hypothetical protein n=1 Tax=Aneurinibacillus uraniidurans TaxID=2966586 RepID=UPI00234BA5E3|nr:hypothetical protein [Aneurinibacillus sp. B1]WCN37013.1 hypothetical protein PO771_14280 [Aneurinibacillus sp. B1]